MRRCWRSPPPGALKRPMWLRYVLVPGLTDDPEEMERVAEFGASLGVVERVEILPFHQMGKYKWERLGLDYQLAAHRSGTRAGDPGYPGHAVAHFGDREPARHFRRPPTQYTPAAPRPPRDHNLELYGFAQLDAIQDFNRVNPDWDATLRPSRIPTQRANSAATASRSSAFANPGSGPRRRHPRRQAL
jgi:hypothetical protein